MVGMSACFLTLSACFHVNVIAEIRGTVPLDPTPRARSTQPVRSGQLLTAHNWGVGAREAGNLPTSSGHYVTQG